jgi:chitinase
VQEALNRVDLRLASLILGSCLASACRDPGRRPAGSNTGVASTYEASASSSSSVVEDSSIPQEPASDRWFMGYLTSWEHAAAPLRLEVTGVTHLAMARAVPKVNGTLDLSPDGHPMGPQLHAMRAATTKAKKKLVFMIGGMGTHDGWIAATKGGKLDTLVSALESVVKTYSLDGLDIDWEPLEESDEDSFRKLVTALRTKLPVATLTFPAEWNHVPSAETIKVLAATLDRVNVMTYNMSGKWPGWTVWHTSALYGSPSSVDKIANMWTSAGFPPKKLGIGIGAYGLCWRGSVSRPDMPVDKAEIVASDNTIPFDRIRSEFLREGKHHWDEAAKAPYLTFDPAVGKEKCSYIAYDDERSVQEKALYAKQKGFGSMIVWTLGQARSEEKGRSVLLAPVTDHFLR